MTAAERRQRLVMELVEPRGGELADRLEHPVAVRSARVGAPPHEALVDQRCEGVEVGAADLLRGFERAAAAEDRETREEIPLVGREEIVRPGDRRP